MGVWLELGGLLFGLGACGDDAGVGSDGTATASSGSSSSGSGSTAGTSVGPGATSQATGADTTAAGTSSGGTTVALDGTSSGGTTRGDSSGEASSSGGATTSGTTTSGGGGPACGDSSIDPGEQCDGADLQGFDCVSLGLGDGTLSCDPLTCTFDTSQCGLVGNCGNGVINPGEQCDGADRQGFDCASLGLGGGVLGCDPITCTFDTSMCMPGGGTSG